MGDARRILEGECPTHGTPLERMDDYGWCAECGIGHSATWDPTTGTGSWNIHLRRRTQRDAGAPSATSDQAGQIQ